MVDFRVDSYSQDQYYHFDDIILGEMKSRLNLSKYVMQTDIDMKQSEEPLRV